MPNVVSKKQGNSCVRKINVTPAVNRGFPPGFRLLLPLVVALLPGCPDVGISQSCVCVEALNQIGWPTWGTDITAIEPVGLWSFLMCSGRIGGIQVEGGNDQDVVYNDVVPPLDGCGGGCAPSQECFNLWGNGARACSVLVGNLDTPYVFLEWGGYLDAVEPHLNTAPLFHTWLMRAPYQYVGVNTPFHVIASRTGASQSELYGENFAERRFDGLVLPPPRYTMSIAKHPDAADLLLSGPDSDGSEDLRRDMAENPQAGPQTYLHEIVSETSDNSVCVDYRVVSQTENTLVPINLDFMSFWHRVMLEYFNGLGYDIFIVDHIYDVEDRPPPDGPEYNGVYAVGIDSIDFIIMAAREIAYDGVDTKQVFFHEIGHCVGLRHNEVNEGTGPPVFPKNLMRSIYANMGMDVNIMFDQSAKMADGSSNWND